MEKRNVKNLFIGILIFLPLQYGMVGIVGEMQSEPWPAFVFPGFKTVHHFQGKYLLERSHFEIQSINEENDTHHLTPRRFFYDIPVQNINGFMRTVFTDQDAVDKFTPETLKWLKDRAEEVTGSETRDMRLVRSKEFARRIELDLRVDSVAIQQVIDINLQVAGNE